MPTPNDFTANAATYKLVGPIPGLNSAVSRKTHAGAGTFDIDLPLAGASGVECRTGGPNGDHQIVFTFANSGIMITGNPQASVTSGSGSVTGVSHQWQHRHSELDRRAQRADHLRHTQQRQLRCRHREHHHLNGRAPGRHQWRPIG